MEPLIIIVLAAVLGGPATVAATAAVRAVLRRRARPLPPPVVPPPAAWLEQVVLRQVVLHTKDIGTVTGFLAATYDDGVVVKSATMRDADVTLAGDVFVPRSQIVLAQMET